MIVYGKQVLDCLLEFKPRLITRAWIDKSAEFRELQSVCRVETPVPRKYSAYAHQGVVLEIHESALLGEDLDWAWVAKQNVILVLDHIEDPQNLGAICRSAALLGAACVVYPKARAAQVTPTVVKASAGLIFAIKLIRVSSLTGFLDQFRKKTSGWVFALSQDGSKDLAQLPSSPPLCIVVGNEGHGVSKGVMGQVDGAFFIPVTFPHHSLNAAQAATIALYQASLGRYT
jgi:tRNA G18 (ribose-2'-O)-methylase SpoU